jgi:nicotinamide phosphoribosyltransferase
MKNQNPMLLADFYKINHRLQYPKNTEILYSTWTPRASRMKGVDKVVAFGFQAFIKNYLIDYFNDNFFDVPVKEIVQDYRRTLEFTLGVKDANAEHIIDLHELGYLPLSIKALPEGTLVPLRVPMLTIQNTDPKFFWLTNYIETLASCELWQASTSATIAYEYRKILDKAAMETVGNTEFVGFQGHDFSMRGLSSLNSAVSSGMGHLLSFVGTDTIPAIQGAESLYNANIEKELVGTSIPATEHSIQCAYGNDVEYLTKMITEVHPTGFVSVVSDGYDFWDVIGRVIPALKDKIMARDGRLVIRPDSGDPVLIVCGDPNGKTALERDGAVEALWNIFGGTVTEKGYRVLDSHIGLIYGDAITLNRAQEITNRLKENGFASINVVFGIGSYTYQYNTRDTFGFALKSTLCVINGQERQIFKDPKTDNGIKKSQKGRVAVLKDNNTLKVIDGLSLNDDIKGDMLTEVFRDGQLLIDQTFNDIRNRLKGV